MVVAERATAAQTLGCESGITVPLAILPLVVRPCGAFTDDHLYEFCRRNDGFTIERSALGELTIMAPASYNASRRNLKIASQLDRWATRDGTGEANDSSGGFILPDSSMLAPDAAWVQKSRLATVPREQQEKFLPLCPDFVIELLSRTDRLRDARAKMHQYLDNGLRLGWLIDPFERRVYVYRPGTEVEVHDDPDSMEGDPELPGFRLELKPIWS